jgi:hypothetical protein
MFFAAWSQLFPRIILHQAIRSVITHFKMPSLRLGLIIRASELNHSKPTNPQSEQLLDDSMTIHPCAARVTAEAPTNSQQNDLDSDKSTGAPAVLNFHTCLGETNGEVRSDADGQISVFLDQNLVGDITPAVTATSNDTSLGDGSQDQPDADCGLLVADSHGDKSACDSAGNQSSLSTGMMLPSIPRSYPNR